MFILIHPLVGWGFGTVPPTAAPNPRIGDFAGARASGGQQFGDRFLTQAVLGGGAGSVVSVRARPPTRKKGRLVDEMDGTKSYHRASNKDTEVTQKGVLRHQRERGGGWACADAAGRTKGCSDASNHQAPCVAIPMRIKALFRAVWSVRLSFFQEAWWEGGGCPASCFRKEADRTQWIIQPNRIAKRLEGSSFENVENRSRGRFLTEQHNTMPTARINYYFFQADWLRPFFFLGGGSLYERLCFLTAYSMRYVRDVGAIFRCYPTQASAAVCDWALVSDLLEVGPNSVSVVK